MEGAHACEAGEKKSLKKNDDKQTSGFLLKTIT